MFGKPQTCVDITPCVWFLPHTCNMFKLCWKTHIGVGNPTYVWENPHTFRFTHICVLIPWPVWFLSNTMDMLKLGENNNKFVNYAILSKGLLIHWAFVWCLVDLWQPDKMEGAITPIRHRSNRQTLEKFKSFPTGFSQKDNMKEIKEFIGVIKSNKKQFIKNQIEDFITEQKTLKQSIKMKIMDWMDCENEHSI